MHITLSLSTQQLLAILYPGVAIQNNSMAIADIIGLITELSAFSEQARKNQDKARNRIVMYLLEDVALYCSHILSSEKTLSESQQLSIASEQHKSKSNRLGLWLSMAALIILGCESFDGIASVLGLFALNPWLVLLIACGVCVGSILLNKQLQMMGSQSHDFENQFVLINQIITSLETGLNENTPLDCNGLLELLEFLRGAKQYAFAEMNRQQYSRKYSIRKAAQYTITGFLSGIIFCGGFFTGQAVALFIAGLFTVTVATAWPVLISAILP